LEEKGGFKKKKNQGIERTKHKTPSKTEIVKKTGGRGGQQGRKAAKGNGTCCR